MDDINYDTAWAKGIFDAKEGHNTFLTVAVAYIEMKRNGIGFCLLCILQRPMIILYSFTAHASWGRGRVALFFPIFFLTSRRERGSGVSFPSVGKCQNEVVQEKQQQKQQAKQLKKNRKQKENDVKTKYVCLFCLIFGVILL